MTMDEGIQPEDFRPHRQSTGTQRPSFDLGRRDSQLGMPVDGNLAALVDYIRTLENRLSSVEGEQSDHKTDVDQFKLDPNDDMREAVEDRDKGSPFKNVKTIPEVRKCTLTEFKNRFGEYDGSFAVEAMVAGSLVQQEIEEELKLRQEFVMRRATGKGKLAKGASKGKGTPIETCANAVDKAIHTQQSSKTWIQRIRIQSPAILSILSKILRESWTLKPRTYFRPFSPLIYFHDQMKEALRQLEAKWGSFESSDHPPTPHSRESDMPQPPIDENHFELHDSPDALADMRAYVKFIDEEVIPLSHQYDNCDATSRAKIRFDDLAYLFRAGERVFVPPTNDSERAINVASRQMTWKIYGITPPHPRYRIDPGDHRKYSRDDEINSSFVLHCYYIDYRGDEFCVVTDSFNIRRFDDECLVRSLNIYPWRFVTDHKRVLEEFEKTGRDFLHYIEVKHSTYNWWTLTWQPNGDPEIDADGVEIKHPEHVNSEVIVDFVQALQTCPKWGPKRSIIKPEDPNPSSTTDEFTIRHWSDADRTKLLHESTEIINLRSGVYTWERNRVVHTDKFLASVRENDRDERLTTAQYLDQSDLCLLPIRVFAYVLQERKFVSLDVQKLRPVKESYNAFECLKINPRYKQTVQALVEAHFMKKGTEKEGGVEGMTQDLIQGKGKGLFILLHGVPGVGKTATAEAVAQANGKPLFAITCGDLGLTPKEVEQALRGIFRLAHLWDCVLLLDEVDTFFSQRAKADVNITKNALVSVFLRVLEYYNGILFLTTNRPGALDEAFKSRIHLKLYYPPLSYNQTREIWMMNIERLRTIEEQRCSSGEEQPLQIYEDQIMDFAMQQYHQNPDGNTRWNGRQIRNAFQIAASLAYYDARKTFQILKEQNPDTQPLRPKLDVEHFSMMHNITESFDQYIEATVGKSAAELAYDAGERHDGWNHRASSEDVGGPGSYMQYGNTPHSFGGRAGNSSWGTSHGPANHWQSQSGRRPPQPQNQPPMTDYDENLLAESPGSHSAQNPMRFAPPSPKPPAQHQRPQMRGAVTWGPIPSGSLHGGPTGEREYVSQSAQNIHSTRSAGPGSSAAYKSVTDYQATSTGPPTGAYGTGPGRQNTVPSEFSSGPGAGYGYNQSQNEHGARKGYPQDIPLY